MEAKANGAAFQPASDFRDGLSGADQELSLRDQKFSLDKQKSWSTDQNFGSAQQDSPHPTHGTGLRDQNSASGEQKSGPAA
jgi:hypothetical protein